VEVKARPIGKAGDVKTVAQNVNNPFIAAKIAAAHPKVAAELAEMGLSPEEAAGLGRGKGVEVSDGEGGSYHFEEGWGGGGGGGVVSVAGVVVEAACGAKQAG